MSDCASDSLGGFLAHLTILEEQAKDPSYEGYQRDFAASEYNRLLRLALVKLDNLDPLL